FAAVAATLSIAAIFIPVAFMQGSIGRFFFQFGITCTVAVLLSLVVSLTITPMLCSVFLDVRQMRRPLPRAWGGLFGFIPTLLTRLYWLLDRWVLEPVLLAPTDWLMNRMARWYQAVVGFSLARWCLSVVGSASLALLALVSVTGVNVALPEWLAGPTGVRQLA